MSDTNQNITFQYANECDLEIHCSPFGLSGLYIKIKGTNIMGIGSTMGLITGSTTGLIHYNDCNDLIDQKYKLYVVVDDDGNLRIDFTKIFTLKHNNYEGQKIPGANASGTGSGSPGDAKTNDGSNSNSAGNSGREVDGLKSESGIANNNAAKNSSSSISGPSASIPGGPSSRSASSTNVNNAVDGGGASSDDKSSTLLSPENSSTGGYSGISSDKSPAELHLNGFTPSDNNSNSNNSPDVKREGSIDIESYEDDAAPTLVFRGKCPEGRPDKIDPFIGIFSFERED